MIDIDEAYADITEQIENPGQYSHQVVGYTLRIVARDHGMDAANKMVDDLDLDDLFGIKRVNHGTG